MKQRLSPLHLLPPPTNTPWTGGSLNPVRSEIRRKFGASVPLPLPLFWYDPPWHEVTADQADNLAVGVGELGVLVAALRSDLAGPDCEPVFHSGRDSESVDGEDTTVHRSYPRMLPYRSERYGLTVGDFDGSSVVDLRLSIQRDVSGRFAYSPSQIQRWEATPTTSPVAGGSWVPAATFPPDVVSIEHLETKVEQLRRLVDSAAVFISLGPYRLEKELPAIVATHPDGIILRLDEISLEGLELAALTRRARYVMDAAKANTVPLWVVPGKVSPDDAVKLIALGASAVAVDSWCNELIHETHMTGKDATLSYSSPTSHQYDPRWGEFAKGKLGERIQRVEGLFESLQSVANNERLGSLSATWAKTLGVLALG
ncbi:hypothetical protein CA13_33370 [Planctomycetes bacterium CA13]|uniref:Uncharacterized protein n=1 Tax=Novipirellula herctigrandis TaxID=2527986 RepID=A0A5C5Z3C2_9BACT|nr:hypothetical protein CA13_33370 [Planctomycetes bacterium CA13]